MRFLRVIFGAILLILLIVFAVANRQDIGVSLDPLPFVIELPLYLLVFVVFFAGLGLGALAGRLNAWSAARRRARQEQIRQRQAKAQEAEAQKTEIALSSQSRPGGPPPPAPIL